MNSAEETNESEKRLNVDDAAKFLNISRRTFEREWESGKLRSQLKYRTAKDGKKRKVRTYLLADLQAFKLERESPEYKNVRNENKLSQILEGINTVLTELSKIGKLPALLKAINRKNKVADISHLPDKLILTLSEASDYSGLRDFEIIAGIKSGKIRGTKKRIWRKSLEKFAKKRSRRGSFAP